MKHTNQQKGIAHVAIIAFVVVLATVAFGGWWVWSRNQDSKPKQMSGSTEQVEQKKEDEKDSFAVPEGWKQYKNSEAGFSFYYPPEWGEVEELETAYKFSKLSGPTFDIHERTMEANSMEFGDITPLVIDVYMKNNKPVVELVSGFTAFRGFTSANVVKTLGGNHICLIDEYDPIDYGVDPETTVYFYNGYCGLVNEKHGSFVLQGYIRDRNDSTVPKLKEDIKKLLQTFEIF